ncbi:MAG: hypothetical protein EBR82_54750 [Caulobacteraceae bacterium]|nr:hypothetical protein [Caulobacteraceae bacterium]
MKAILFLTAVLVAPVMAGDLDEFVGTTYDSGNAVFGGGRGVAITQNGLVVKNGTLFITPHGLYSSCGNMYYGNGKLTVVDGYFSYSNDGTSRTRVGNYFAGNKGQTYIYESSHTK